MKIIIKENGIEKKLFEGAFPQAKKYLVEELGNLIDWADCPENKWEGDWKEYKADLLMGIQNAQTSEELGEVFDDLNRQMSWWGLFVE